MAITLNGGQSKALAAIKTWVDRKWEHGLYRNPRVFTLHGYAGTGKTTIARFIADYIGSRALFVAYTGKAASVIHRKTGHDAYTIHAIFKDFIRVNPKTGEPEFLKAEYAKTLIPIEEAILIIDEASMVSHELAQEILSFGSRILAIGDPGQLGPVPDGKSYFDTADFFLDEIVRQAADNPIIQASFDIRTTGTYKDTPGVIDTMWMDDVPDEFTINAGAILCHENPMRCQLNDAVRKLMGYSSVLPEAGEKVICLRNNRRRNIYNGGVYTTVEGATDETIIIIGDDGKIETVNLNPIAFYQRDKPQISSLDHRVPFDYGYAMTVHKAQGSEWDAVLIVDDFKRRWSEEYRRWFYTAITRASRRVIIAKFH